MHEFFDRINNAVFQHPHAEVNALLAAYGLKPGEVAEFSMKSGGTLHAFVRLHRDLDPFWVDLLPIEEPSRA